MAYSVNWLTKVVTIPLSDLMLVEGSNYVLNVDYAHDEIRRLEWEFSQGLWAEHAIEYINSYILSGLTYSPVIRMINGYTWYIDTTNINVGLVGSNSNFLDTFIPGNGVSVLANNSAGKTSDDVALTPEQDTKLTEVHNAHHRRRHWDKDAQTITLYEEDKTTPDKVFDTNDDMSDITPQ